MTELSRKKYTVSTVLTLLAFYFMEKMYKYERNSIVKNEIKKQTIIKNNFAYLINSVINGFIHYDSTIYL